jgi:hypothetical protein
LVNNPQQRPKGLISGLASIQNRNSSRMYKLTQHGEDGLIDFFTFDRTKRFDIRQHIFEETQYSNINSATYAVVAGLDINKILSVIYGSEENGNRLQYQLTLVRSKDQTLTNMNLTPQAASQDYILYLSRISLNELSKVSGKLGYIQTNGIYMVGRHNNK